MAVAVQEGNVLLQSDWKLIHPPIYTQAADIQTATDVQQLACEVSCCSFDKRSPWVQEGNVIMQPDGEVDIPIRRPDGDVELGDSGKHFRFPPCKRCGGVLKPNVVFFGDSIPKDRALRSGSKHAGLAMTCCAWNAAAHCNTLGEVLIT